jgi:predicted RNA-binding Zn-ribbon protein involved in translation (DUF1610 family)
MACVENQCTSCDWQEFANQRRASCPKCGSAVQAISDESHDEEHEE